MSGGGLATYQEHSILLRDTEARLPTILHELGHLLAPGGEHGPTWIGIMWSFWEQELHIPRGIAVLAAQQLTKHRAA